ncbi:MAG: transposase [Acidobacteriaceae bacterium]|nr:transposase [Acidobacteriaceae bacterium]MBV9780204.1 transposase [Acidobacteriaceae bacterium]
MHKIRNVVDHFSEEHQMAIRCKLRNAYATRDYVEAQRACDSLLHQLMHLNLSAARSLEESREEPSPCTACAFPANCAPVWPVPISLNPRFPSSRWCIATLSAGTAAINTFAGLPAHYFG